MFKQRTKTENLITKLEDNRFNSSECRQIEKIFATIDRNSSGFISKQEMLYAFKNSRKRLTEGQIMFTFSAMDTDGNGKIDLQEFANFIYVSKNPKEDPHEVRRIFAGFDTDKDGLIGKGDLREALRSLGLQVSPKDIERFFEYIDSDKSGDLDFEEFELFYRLVRSRNSP